MESIQVLDKNACSDFAINNLLISFQSDLLVVSRVKGVKKELHASLRYTYIDAKAKAKVTLVPDGFIENSI